MKSWEIAGYTFRAANYHPGCLLEVMPFGPGEAFDGWRTTSLITVEENLDELAAAFGVNRQNESSFDSGDFPKVIFADSVEDDEECGKCGEPLR